MITYPSTPPQLYQSGRHLPPLHFHWSYKLHESLFKKSNSLFSKEIFIFWSLAHSSSIMTNIRLRRSRWGHSISKMPTVIRRKKVFFFIVPLTLAPRLVTHDFILRFLRFWDFWDFLFFWYFFLIVEIFNIFKIVEIIEIFEILVISRFLRFFVFLRFIFFF